MYDDVTKLNLEELDKSARPLALEPIFSDEPEIPDTLEHILEQEIFDNGFKPLYKTVEKAREELEDKLITSLFDVLKEGKPDLKLKAINTAIELLGLKENLLKAIVGDNVQINFDKKPEISQALINSITGIKDVAKGSAKKIRTQRGGKGA